MADEQKAAPAARKDVPTPAPAATTESLLAQALAQLSASNARIAELMERQHKHSKATTPKRKTTMREFQKKHPEKRLRHPVFQNGHDVNPAGLSDATIKKLDTLATGTYCDGLVDVIRIKDGINGKNSRIHIFYNNRSLEQRMVFYMRFPTFTKLVDDIAAEMAALAGGDKTSRYAPVEEEPMDGPADDDETTEDDE